MKKFDVLYLHIGLEKTGTTSIQTFLNVNRGKLAKAGIFVPRSAGADNHKLLAAHAFNAGAQDIAVTSANVGSSPDEVAQFRSRVEGALAREVAESDAHTAVISSEDYSRLFHREEVSRALDLVRTLSDDVRVLVFLRRQDLLAVSRYYSLLLGGSMSGDVLPPDGAKVPRYYFYERNLRPWIEAVGPGKFRLVRFPERFGAEKFSSVVKFCEILGLSVSDFTLVKDQHVSLDAVNQLILHQYNVLRPGHDWIDTKRLVGRLHDMNDQRCKVFVSGRQASGFYEQFRESNRRLLSRLGAEDQMFSEDFTMYPERNIRTDFEKIAIRRLLELLEMRESASCEGDETLQQ